MAVNNYHNHVITDQIIINLRRDIMANARAGKESDYLTALETT